MSSMKRTVFAFFYLAPFAIGDTISLQNIVTIDVPGARRTVPKAINSNGDIAGYFQESNNSFSGFRYSRAAGTFTTFRIPGAGDVVPGGITDSGVIAGVFGTSVPDNHFFLRFPNGTDLTFDYPSPGYLSTLASINNIGEIAGSFAPPGQDFLGFIRSADGNAFTTFRIAGAPETEVYGINDVGQVVGRYQPTPGTSIGFIRNKEGTFITVVPPDSSVPMPIIFLAGINNSGEAVGTSNSGRGFLRTPEGFFYFLEVPGYSGTSPAAISDKGEVVGTYYDANNDQRHGFVGQFTPVPEPSALPLFAIVGAIWGLGIRSKSISVAAVRWRRCAVPDCGCCQSIRSKWFNH